MVQYYFELFNKLLRNVVTGGNSEENVMYFVHV